MNTLSTNTKISSLIWHYLKQYKGSLLIFAITSIIWASEISITPYLLKLMIDGINKTADNPSQLIETIVIPAILYTSMGLILTVIFRIYGYTCLKLFPKLREQIIADFYRYVSQHSYRYFQEHFSGNLTSKLKDIADGFEQIIQLPNEYFIPRTISVIIAAIALTLVQPLLSILLLAWVIIFVLTTFHHAKKIQVKARIFSESNTQLSGRLTDNITNSITTKIFAREREEFQRIHSELKTVAKNDQAMKIRMQLAFFSQGILVPLLTGPFIVVMIYERLHGSLTVGDFAFVLSLAMMISMSIWDIGRQIVLFITQLGKCNQALNVLIEPHEIQDKPDATNIIINKGAIEFDRVNFRYNENKPLFTELSVYIKPGEKVGLVGYSGGGKSSFSKLILRLFDIQSGNILIDEQSISEVTKESLREQIAMIPQDPEMFHRTIFDNIRYGKVDATNDEVIEAAKRAHCHEFIMSLENGYDTLVGERGVKLSGGQRQRISIARAILKNAPILILDEATSALDSVTEHYIQQSLDDMMQNKTTIVIAHRLSTLRAMDRILVFEDGVIVEDGSLDELRDNNSSFAKLWDMQHSGYLPQI